MRRFFTIIVSAIFSLTVSAQRQKEEAPPVKDRIFYGGNFGLQFGTYTDIQLSPVIGFWLLPRLNVAAGPDYRFYKAFNEKTHIYGGKFYTEFILLRNINSVIPIGTNTHIISHFEDELLSLETAFFKLPPYTSKRFTVNTYLAGLGLSQEIGRRASINFLFLWALNDSEYQLNSNPDIRITFTF